MDESQTPEKKRPGQTMTAIERVSAQARFLTAFAKQANITQACKVARIARATVYAWQEHDEEFAQAFRQAELAANDALRAEIHRRAVVGVLEPVYHAGVKVGSVRKYSDTLLIFLAKARMPEFRDKVQVEQSGQVVVRHDFGDDPETAALARGLLSRLSSGASDPGGPGLSGEQ